MNWALLSEKFGREENNILIFCAKEDRDNPWIKERADMYRKDGYKVFVKVARSNYHQSDEKTEE